MRSSGVKSRQAWYHGSAVVALCEAAPARFVIPSEARNLEANVLLLSHNFPPDTRQ